MFWTSSRLKLLRHGYLVVECALHCVNRYWVVGNDNTQVTQLMKRTIFLLNILRINQVRIPSKIPMACIVGCLKSVLVHIRVVQIRTNSELPADIKK